MEETPWNKLVAIVLGLEAQYSDDDDQWEDSAFKWIKTRPSRQVGAIGERIVSDLLEWQHFTVERSPDSDADRLVNRNRVEIKFSTLWKAGGYKFQQIRDQHYEFAICFGASPDRAHMWIFPKTVLADHVIGKAGQHGGKNARDTDWITFAPDSPPDWAKSWGGDLAAGLAVAERLLR